MNGLLFILVLFGFSWVADAIGRTEEGFCLQSQHSCNDISCIPQSHVCNGDEECVDGSDEVGCADAPTCSGGLIPCPKTTGVTSCVETQDLCPEPTGCGALPSIVNGEASFIGFWNKKSSIGAWADVICNEGYKSCTNKIRCLESGVWTTTVCEQEQPEETDRCYQELGECNLLIYSKSNLVALKSSDCDYYCQCVHNGTNSDGSVSYKWWKRPCPVGTKFDQPIHTCNHASSVTCPGIRCFQCKDETSHAACNAGALEICDENKQSCQTVIDYYQNNTIKILFKGCKNPTANAANEILGCQSTESKTFCREKCVTDSCNSDHQLQLPAL